jgi:uncharacterized protein
MDLFDIVVNQFPLGQSSIHGPSHWKRVESNGLWIASQNGADEQVVMLFALFHDCRRKVEHHDEEHGKEAARFAKQCRKDKLFEVDASQWKLLHAALCFHPCSSLSTDPTIGACFDADRLDLVRVGITPEEQYMSTEPGKRRCRELKNV